MKKPLILPKISIKKREEEKDILTKNKDNILLKNSNSNLFPNPKKK